MPMVLSILRDKAVEQFDHAVFRTQSLLPGYPSDSTLQKALRLAEPFDAFIRDSFPVFKDFFLTEEEKDEVSRSINSHFSEWAEAAKMRAEEVLRHRFTLLGTEVETGPLIDWQKDYTRGYSWPCIFSKKLSKIKTDSRGDIKYPWELSRFHQGVFLGKTFALTKDERYAKEFFAQFRDWMLENPSGYGANWKCTMEVAIRAVNLIWSFFFLRNSNLLDRHIKILFLKCMLAHGRYIYKHLEFNRTFLKGRYQPVNGNHYVADLAGLLYISLMFPQFVESGLWFKKAYTGLLSEISLQVDADGVHHELSPNYHRLVLEIFLSSLLLLTKHKIRVPDEAWQNIEKMCEFICHYTKPDDSVPLIRDIDSGRFHILGSEALATHTHLLPLAAILFSRPDFADFGFSEDTLWLLGPDAVRKFDDLAGGTPIERTSRGFETSGFYLLRKDRLYMFALCSPIGREGLDGHSHNDFLSFELFAYDKTFLTDCGSFVYTGQPVWRNRFRSTQSHNTAVIDNREINPISEHSLFVLRGDTRLSVDRWETNDRFDLLEAHYQLGGEMSAEPVHRRAFLSVKDSDGGYWILRDRFEANDKKRHRIDIRFHFSRGIKVTAGHDLSVRTVCDKGANLVLMPLSYPESLLLFLETGWMSEVYGQKHKIQAARYTYSGELPINLSFLLYPIPHREGRADRLPRILSYNDFLMVCEKRKVILQTVEAMGL